MTTTPDAASQPNLPNSDSASLLAEARDLLGELVTLRRRIHSEPELGLHLPLTQATILAELEDLAVEVKTGTSLSSVVATMHGDGEGPTLLLRADMDALPMPEDTGYEFASKHDGTMHACGHDAHVAMLVGAAKMLNERRRDLRGTVKFFFQPGEEGHGGARYAIEEGLLENPSVDAGFALHITPNSPSGTLASKPGPLLASADTFSITVNGKGGHASTPHLTVDPVPVAAEIVLALQTMVTRTVDAFDPAIVTVAQIEAGTTSNVIPESAVMKGTMRTFSGRTRSHVQDSLHRVAHNIAAAHDCSVEVEVSDGYPVTVNDREFEAFARDTLSDLLGSERVREISSPIMGAEDWSYVLERVPGSMAFLGVCPPDLDPRNAPACHSNRMQLDEEAMAVGAAAHAAVALAYLR